MREVVGSSPTATTISNCQRASFDCIELLGRKVRPDDEPVL